MIAMILALQIESAQIDAYPKIQADCEHQLTRFPMGSVGYAGIAEDCATRKREALSQDTGALVATGKCPDAVKLALRAGDLNLAAALTKWCPWTDGSKPGPAAGK